MGLNLGPKGGNNGPVILGASNSLRTANPRVTAQSKSQPEYLVVDGIASTTFATAGAPLGSLVAVSSSKTTNPDSASAPLGALTATASSTKVSHFATASAPLGNLVASASSITQVAVSANAPLGSLTASASDSILNPDSADAPLGELIATASATITTPPSTDVPSLGGSSRPFYYRPQKHEKIVKYEPQWVNAQAKALLGSLNASAISSITFSILEDDQDVLLLV